MRSDPKASVWPDRLLGVAKNLSGSILLGAALGGAIGLVIITAYWILWHPKNEAFEMAMYGIAQAGFLPGAKAGAISLPVARFVLLDKAGLKNTIVPLVVYATLGGLAGLAFGSPIASEWLAVGAFFLGALNISQYRANKSQGLYYDRDPM